MERFSKAFMIGALSAFAAASADAAEFTPPMDSINDAYYTCASGGAFLVAYDGPKPTTATITTNNNNHTYRLKRTAVSQGVEFKGAGATFWTDGARMSLSGTEAKLADCTRKRP